jgi:hypothetical protein
VSRENDEGNSPSQEEPAIDPLPQQYGLGVTGKAALATGVAILSAAYPPAAIPFAGAGAALQAVGERLNALQQVRTSELLAGASTESSLTPEEVVRELLDRDDLVLLAAEAIDAARRSRLPGKAATLGQSLGAILADDALVDLESIWIRIIGVVEAPHIRILGMLLEHTGTMGTGSKLFGPGAILTVSDIGDRLGLQEAVLPLIEDLTRSGLLMNPGAEGMKTETEGIYELPPDAFGQPVKATTLGAQLFARLSVAGLAESN